MHRHVQVENTCQLGNTDDGVKHTLFWHVEGLEQFKYSNSLGLFTRLKIMNLLLYNRSSIIKNKISYVCYPKIAEVYKRQWLYMQLYKLYNYITVHAWPIRQGNKSFCDVPKYVINKWPHCSKLMKFTCYTHAQSCNTESCITTIAIQLPKVD